MVNANTAYFPELWANYTIPVLRQYRVLSRVIATDLNMGEIQQKGDTVNTRVRYPFVPASKAIGSDYTYQDAKAVNVPITLDYHYTVPFVIENVERAKSFKDLVVEYIEPAAEDMIQTIEGHFLDTCYAAGGSGLPVIATPTSGATFDIDDLMYCRQWGNGRKMPPSERYLLLGVTSESKLLNAAKGYLGRDILGEEGSRLKEASMGKLFGTNVLLAGNIETVAASTTPTPDVPAYEKNLFMWRGSVQMISRPLPEPPMGFGAKGTVFNADGIAMRLTMGWDLRRGGFACILEALYGFKVLPFAAETPENYLIGEFRSATS